MQPYFDFRNGIEKYKVKNRNYTQEEREIRAIKLAAAAKSSEAIKSCLSNCSVSIAKFLDQKDYKNFTSVDETIKRQDIQTERTHLDLSNIDSSKLLHNFNLNL